MRTEMVPVADLAELLVAELPSLPPCRTVPRIAAELRAMSSPAAAQVWSHPGWSAIYAWVAHRVPDCDPIRPAIHAVRLAPLVRADREAAEWVRRRVLGIARRSMPDRRPLWEVPLESEMADRLVEPRPVPRSLVIEAADLFRCAGITATRRAWHEIWEGIDIAADWLDNYAAHTGLSGEALVAAARNSAGLSSTARLRRYLSGPTGRPLVALTLGADQWSRHARAASGAEPSLLYWALAVRLARHRGEADPVPPARVTRAWATMVALTSEAVGPAEGAEVAAGPTVAA